MVSKGDGGLTTSPSKRYLIMGLIGLAFIPSVLADDGSGCNNTSGSWNNGGTADCYSPQIYQQNQIIIAQNKILIEEQNQTNNITADAWCQSHYEGGWSSGSYTEIGDHNQCMKDFLERHK